MGLAGMVSHGAAIGEAHGERQTDQGVRRLPAKGSAKRHIVTDTTGLLVGLEVHSAGIQDRDGAPDVLKAVAVRYPMLRVRPAHSDGSRSRSHLCGRRLCWTKTARRAEGHRALDRSDRQTIRHRRRVRSPAPSVGGRAHSRLAGTVPSPVKGLGEIHRQRRSMGAHRPHPTRHPLSRKGLTALN